MSDVTYFFVFLLGLVLYIKALTDGRWKWFIISGVVTGLAVLVRPVGQFWPLAMIVLAALSSFRPNREFFSYAYGRYELIGKSSTAIVIVLAIMSLWIIRNHNVHGVAAVAFSSANGPAHIAALTIGQERGVKHGQVWAEWIEDYKDTTGQSAVTLGETFRIYASKAPELIDSLGWKAYRTYLTILWNNLNDIAYGHRTLLPSLRYYSIKSDNWFRRNNLNYIVFGLSMLGFVLLFLKRQYRLAVILGCVYFYYVPMIGFYRWQGARYFYPGQIAWSVLLSIVLVTSGQIIDRWLDVRRRIGALWRRLLTTAKDNRSIEPESVRQQSESPDNPTGRFLHSPFSKRDRTALILILALGLAVRLLLFAVADHLNGLQGAFEASPDAMNYMKMGRSIISGEGTASDSFFMFGPGYAFFLALSMFFLKAGLTTLIGINVLLSAATVGLLYLFTVLLTRSIITALIAAVLIALSATSISLSCYLLSDTTYLFSFLASLVLFVKALSDGKWRWFVLAGTFTGLAILVRPIGQFWPLAMLVIALAYLLRRDNDSSCHRFGRIELARKLAVSIAITLGLMSTWVVHNYYVHDTMALSFSSAGGPANIAVLTEAKVRGVPPGTVGMEWREEYRRTSGKWVIPLKALYVIYKEKSSDIILSHPWEVFKIYSSMVWDNLNEISYLQRNLLPDHVGMSKSLEFKYKGRYFNYASFVLSMLGLFLLIWRRQYRVAVVLGLIYFYYTSMIGFTRWQGSRLFFPGQVASSVLTATVLVAAGGLVLRWIRLKSVMNKLWHITLGFARRYIVEPVLNFDPEEHRSYILWFAAAVLVPLVILFRKFIFSDLMLCGGGDPLAAGVFFRQLLVNTVLSTGSIPMWNPYILAGLPFVDAFHSDIFYPFSMMKYLGPIHRMMGYSLIAHIFFAGLTMYLTARELGLSKLAATFSGTSYMFASWIISLVAPGHDGKLYVTTLFPLLILFTNRGFRTRPLLNFTLLGAVIGCMILTPHLQLSYYSMLCLTAFGIYKLIALLRSRRSLKALLGPSSGLVLAVVLGLLISSIQIVPGLNYTLTDSPRTGRYSGYQWATRWSLHQEELFSLIVPDFCGTDSWSDREMNYWGVNSIKDNLESAGTVALFCALLGLFLYRRKGSWFWAAVALLTLIYALGATTPLFKLYFHFVPFFSKIRAPSTAMFLFSFSTALLGGFFIESLKERRHRAMSKLPSLFIGLLWGLPLAVSAIGLLYVMAGEETLRLYARLFNPSLLADDRRAESRLADAVAYLPYIKAGFIYTSAFLWAAAALIWAVLKRNWRPVLLLLLPLLVVANSLRFNGRFINVLDFDDEFGAMPVVEFLKTRGDIDRVTGFALSTRKMHLPEHGVSMAAGYHGNEPKWYHDMLHYGGRSSWNILNQRFANLVNMGYVIYPPTGVLPLDTLGPIPFDTAAVFENEVVFRNHNRFPRAYLVGQYEVVPDRHDILPLVMRGDSDLRNLVYLEEKPELEMAGKIDSSATAEIEYYGLDSIRIEVSCSTNQVLCMSDNWYNAWHAFVDGKESKLYRAYGSFRAVEVPAGSKEVVFKYDSPIYRRGRALTILGTTILFVVLGYYGFGYVRRRRGARTV